jgi:hypothetical protein
MALKRSASPSSSYSVPQTTPKKIKMVKQETSSPSQRPSGWTSESKGMLIDRLITIGLQHALFSELAAEVSRFPCALAKPMSLQKGIGRWKLWVWLTIDWLDQETD